MDTTTPTRTRQLSCCGTTSGGSHSEAIDREGVKMSDEDCDVVAEFIRSRGITRCPTACVLPTQGLITAADRIALEQYAVARDRARRERAAARWRFMMLKGSEEQETASTSP